MKNYQKYQKQYFMPPVPCMDWSKKQALTAPPKWCSVDLRDGNQALIQPMSLETKLQFFTFLVELGFKEIEVGFPAASDTEYAFMRALIEQNLIPDDVTVQVLTQAREHIIKKTFEAVKGAKNVIIHVYNSTSLAQRVQVFKKDKAGVKRIAEEGAKMLKTLTEEAGAPYRFEYSPESFTGTEPEYALEVVNAVLDIWQPTPDRKAIINLPATVENAMPHVYAQQVEYMHKNMKYRDAVEISLHPHNDRGCAVAASELGLLAGGDRLEGTLFGNGERTGNADIVTVAMNLFSHGVDPKLNFENMPEICERYTDFTGMQVSLRQPYGGGLVFAAFSGSHQDAIAKGMACRKGGDNELWTVPYLPIDPMDVGRRYESDVIRINSQSGKGGVGYVLSGAYGINLPANMRADFGYRVKAVSDVRHAELMATDVYQIFKQNYLDCCHIFAVERCEFAQGDEVFATVNIIKDGQKIALNATGNGGLDAVSNAFKTHFGIEYELCEYSQHALSTGSRAQAISYVCVRANGKEYWGAGIDDDIMKSSYLALTAAVNNLLKA